MLAAVVCIQINANECWGCNKRNGQKGNENLESSRESNLINSNSERD